MNFRILKEINL